MKRFWLLLLFLPLIVLADTPPPGAVKIKGGTDGTNIGNVGDALKVTGTFSGSTGRTWTLGFATDSVTAYQGGAWTFGRTWNLSSGSDSVSALVSNFPALQAVNLTQLLSATPSATNSLPARITNGTSFVDPTQIRLLTASDVVTANVGSTGRTWTLLHSTDSVNSWSLDGAGNALTSQVNGSQRALDVGIDVAGVQVDPRSIRTLTTSDTVTAVTTGGATIAKDSSLTTINTTLGSPMQNSGGSVTANIGTTGGLQLDTTGAKLNNAQASTTSGQTGPLAQGATTTAAPSYSNGTTNPLSLTPTGALRTDASATTQPISGTVTANAGTNLNTSLLATSANQTNGTQKTQIVDGSGNVITSTTNSDTSNVGASVTIAGTDGITVTATASAVNQDIVPAQLVQHYRWAAVQTVVSGTNTVTFQGSNDNFSNTFAVLCIPPGATTNQPVTTSAATNLYYCPLVFKYFRVRMTAFTSGSNAGTTFFSTSIPPGAFGQLTVNVSNNPLPVSVGQPGLVTDVGSGTITTTTTSSAVTGANNADSDVFVYNVTAINPATVDDVVIQESKDTGTTWRDIYHFERISGVTTQLISTRIRYEGNRFRYVETLSGATQSVTRSITHIGFTEQGQNHKRFFDRTIAPNSSNSTTASFYTGGCTQFSFMVNLSACTTFPTFALQVSEDNTNFATTTDTASFSANGTLVSALNQSSSGKFSRLTISTPGTTCVLGYAAISCYGP